MIAAVLFALVVGTWNGNWFPSGRAEHRAAPEIEAATAEAAARRLSEGIARADPTGRDDVVLCLNEMRNLEAVSNLVARLGRTNLVISTVSAYRRRDRFDMQQDAVVSSLPCRAGSWARWKSEKGVLPPRGYARAELTLADGSPLVVCALHLKSNYGATTSAAREQNAAKRMVAVRQVLAAERPKRKKKPAKTVIAGDFNADKWASAGPEPFFGLLSSAGFANVFDSVSPSQRGTHPSRKWGDSCLDYIFLRDFTSFDPPVVVSCEGISDHDAVFVRVKGL